MRVGTVVAALLVGVPSMAITQTPTGATFQAGVGVAFRAETPYIAGSTNGLHAAARIGIPLWPSFLMVGELSVTRYGDESFAVPSLCVQPQPNLCPRAITTLPGLGVAGVALGVQPRLGSGPVQLLLTGTAGGYWLYHRDSSLPSAAPGFRGSLGLSIEVDPRLRVVMEGGGLYLLRGRTDAANTRNVGVGVLLQ